MPIKPETADPVAIAKAVEILKKGGLVAFPTETVYGLGADASNPEAVKKIFRTKGRPADHPLIVHIGKTEQLYDWAQNIPQAVWDLATKFWPGPLAVILEKHPKVPLLVTGGQQTVGIRIPNNPVALSLLESFSGGIAAPSANRFNHISPTLAEHVVSELGESVDMILDDGACTVGLESTIIDLTGSQARLLRPGHIRPQQIEEVIDAPVIVSQQTEIRAPGMLELHYAPSTPTIMGNKDKINKNIEELLKQYNQIGILTFSQLTIDHENIALRHMPRQPHEYGQVLYAALRDLDNMQLDIILVEAPPDDSNWLAINDRLKKATAANTVLD